MLLLLISAMVLSVVLLGISGFTNYVSVRGSVYGCVPDSGMEGGIVAEGGVGKGRRS